MLILRYNSSISVVSSSPWDVTYRIANYFILTTSISCRLSSICLLSSHTHLISAWQIRKRIPKNPTVCGNIAWGPITLLEKHTNWHLAKVLLSEGHVVMLYDYNFTTLLINVALELREHVPLITKNDLLSDIKSIQYI